MKRPANAFRDDLKPVAGIPTIKPRIGESFDKNNDLFLVDSRTVLHRDGHVTKGNPDRVTHDALLEYDRRWTARWVL